MGPIAMKNRWRRPLAVCAFGLLGVVLAVGCVLSWIEWAAKRRRDLAAALARSERKVTSATDAKAVIWIPGPVPRKYEVGAAIYSEYSKTSRDVSSVVLDKTATDEDLKNLRRLTALRYLVVDGSAITDAGLENLSGLTNLKRSGSGARQFPMPAWFISKVSPGCGSWIWSALASRMPGSLT